jgi:hypothetical protein
MRTAGASLFAKRDGCSSRGYNFLQTERGKGTHKFHSILLSFIGGVDVVPSQFVDLQFSLCLRFYLKHLEVLHDAHSTLIDSQ